MKTHEIPVRRLVERVECQSTLRVRDRCWQVA
jgi:hypothetical protein